MDVRCCCNPGKLLGTIPIRQVPIQKSPIFHKIENTDGEVVELEIAQCRVNNRAFMAVKSNDKPMDFFRKLPGFKEADLETELRRISELFGRVLNISGFDPSPGWVQTEDKVRTSPCDC